MNSTARLLAGLLASASFASIAHAGEVSGNVYDATGTRALQSASVRIVELDRSVETDRSGNYIIADIPAGTYTLEARYVGAEIESRAIEVPQAGSVSGDFDMRAIGGGDILVVGQAANLSSSLSRQKAADGVESVLTRDAIGQFPDQNVAESLRRLPGVNILNDQGEGRFVAVRGLDPELNATSLNGVRVPAPESDTRQVALDVISSDTIESIEVKKSLTPDMDADAIGASIEIKTTSAFDRKKDYYAVRAEGSYNDYSGDITPKGGFDFSKRIGDDFGVSGGVSYYERKFETDNVESDSWKKTDGGLVYSPTVEYRDYDVKRKRFNATLNFDWRASDTTVAYLKGNWSQFDDHEYRRRTTFDFGDALDITGSGHNVTIADTQVTNSKGKKEGGFTIERDLKDRFERQRIRSVVIGSDTDTGTWKFNWSASYAKSSERENFSVDPMRFAKDFEGDGAAIRWDYSDPRVPTYEIASGADLVNSASAYEFDKLELTTLSDSQDREYAIKADLARTFAAGNGDFTIQAGAKQRWRKKSYDFNVSVFKGYDGDFTLADVLGEQTYRLDGISLGPVANKNGSADFYRANEGNFELRKYDSANDSAASDYSIKEDINSAYALTRWDSDALRVIGGVRMEHTRNVLNGNVLTERDNKKFDSPLIETVQIKRNYTDWLPSLTVRWAPQNDLVFRAAGYKSLVRPKLSAFAPKATVNEDNEADFGNPDLKPYEAWNGDVGFEYYFSGNGAISFGAFYKDVKNYAVTQTFDDYTYKGTLYDQFKTTINGDSAEVVGFEASFSQAYTMLPAPFDGLLTQLNYTYTYANGTLADGRKISLPKSSKNTFNVVLGYEKGPIDLRLAGTYRDKYLDEVGASAAKDRYVDNHFQLDFSGKLKVLENLRLTLDVININNAKFFAYQNFADAQRLLQFEKYGPTFKFGARLNF